jgi:transcriptional regulator with XRE-family HTH domain
MGQEIRGSPEAAAVAAAEPGDGSIGSYLARQRRLRGVSIDELANLTRIPRRSLERLEAGAFDATPDGFVRGFVRTVAAALGLDPDDAVNRLLREPREDEAVLLAKARHARRKLALRAALAGAALLAALALGRLLLWAFAGESPGGDPVVYRRDALRSLEAEPEQAPASR